MTFPNHIVSEARDLCRHGNYTEAIALLRELISSANADAKEVLELLVEQLNIWGRLRWLPGTNQEVANAEVRDIELKLTALLERGVCEDSKIEAAVWAQLGESAYIFGRLDDAVTNHKHAVETYESAVGANHPRIVESQLQASDALRRLGRPHEAIHVASTNYHCVRTLNPAVPMQEMFTAAALGQVHLDLEQYEDAEALLLEACELAGAQGYPNFQREFRGYLNAPRTKTKKDK